VSSSRFTAVAAIAIAAFVVTSAAASRVAAKDPARLAAMSGTQFAPGRVFVERWCADCHSQVGTNAKHARAYNALRLDKYEEWKGHQAAIRGSIDKWHLDGKLMPPRDAKSQPTEADRRTILAWLDRGSPNTADGK
jgi:uncharacterized membrane protein